MQTRSSSKFVGEPSIIEIPVVTMADNYTMDEMLQAPTEGYGDVIVVLDVLAENFEIRTGLLSLIQANQFRGFKSNNPHDHIRTFNRITSTLKFSYVPNDAIKLMLFPYSLEGAAKIWYEKEPPRSILTWGDLKFKETFGEAWERFKEMLRQCPHHGFSELHQIDTFYNGLNEHEQDSLNAAAGRNLLSRTPKDALTIIENKSKVRYSRHKPVASKVSTTSCGNSSSTDARIDKLTDTISNLVETFNKKMTTPATVKAVEETCVICGGAHPYYECIATDSNTSSACAATGNNVNQGNNFQGNQGFQAQTNHAPNFQVPNNQVQNGFSNEFVQYMKTNDDNMRMMRSQMNNMKTEFQSTLRSQNNKIDLNQSEIKKMFACLMNNPSGLGQLPSNTIANPRGDLKAITTRSGVSYDGPLIPPPFSSVPKVVEWVPEATKDTVQPSTENIQPPKLPEKLGDPDKFLIPCDFPELDECLALADLDQSTTRPAGIAEDVFVKVGKFYFPSDFVVVDYVVDPRVPLILGRPLLRTGRALIDVYGEELTLQVDDEAKTFKVGQTSKYSYNDAELIKRIDVIDVTCEEYVQEVLGFSDNSKSGNPTPTSDPIIALSSPSLTPFEGGNFILEEIEACHTNKLIRSGIDDTDSDLEEDIRLIENLLNDDPSPSPLPLKELNVEEIKTVKSSIDEPSKTELKELPSYLEYTFLERTDKLPVIISKELKMKKNPTF
nr:reverse transcriptase domain-containing protein [Tanacetum cinerariifolium]